MKKRRGRKFLIFLAIILLVTLVYDTYIRIRYYEWEFVNDTDEIQIIVDDVLYTQFVFDDWRPRNMHGGARIGKNLYSLGEEPLSLFLLYDRPIVECEEMFFIKDGVVLPEFCSENADKLEFTPIALSQEYENSCYSEIRNREVINNFFLYIETPSEFDYYKYTDAEQIAWIAKIELFNEEIKDINVYYQVFAIGDKYYIRIMSGNTYAEISTELLSEIAGINMPEPTFFYDMEQEEIYKLFTIG